MRKFYLALSAVVLLSSLQLQAAPGDGTFVINITGPAEEEAVPESVTPPVPQDQTQTAAPVRQNQRIQPQRTAAVAAQLVQDMAPVQQSRTYQVQRNDTIWSIANRFLPIDGAVNEFQTVAAIYRANPQAFADGNINQLRRVTLIIPPQDQIARESSSTGSALLRGELAELPPLAVSAENIREPSPASVSTPVAQIPASRVEQTLPESLPPREYVARETRVREGDGQHVQPENPAQVVPDLLPPENPNRPDEYYNDNDGSAGDAQGQTLNAQNDPGANAAPVQVQELSQQHIDFAAVRDLIDSTRKSIEIHDQQVNKRLAEAVNMSTAAAKDAAQTVAHDEVFSIMNRYEAIISDLQQSNAELRANISKLSKQIDQVRQMSLNSADELELIKQNLALDQSSSNRIVPQGPLMWILLGFGMMTLVLALALFIFKRRSRNADEAEDDYGFDDDLSSTELISSSIINKDDETKPEIDPNDLSAQIEKDQQNKEAKEQPEQVVSSSEPEGTESNRTESPDDQKEAQKIQDQQEQVGSRDTAQSATLGQGAGVEIVGGNNLPTGGNGVELAGDVVSGGKAAISSQQPEKVNFDAAETGMVDDVKIPSGMIDQPLADKAAAAWNDIKDRPVVGNSPDDWAQCQEQNTDAEIELSETTAAADANPESQLAAQWDAALQQEREIKQEQVQQQATADSDPVDMDELWAAAMQEQKLGERKAQSKKRSGSVAGDGIAEQWKSALKAQAAEQKEKKAASGSDNKGTTVVPEQISSSGEMSPDEALAAQWEAALAQQSEAAKSTEYEAKTGTSTSAPAQEMSADEKLAAQWEAALAQQSGAAKSSESETKTDTSTSAPAQEMSADEKLAAQWEAALQEQADPKTEAPAAVAGSAAGAGPEEAELPDDASYFAKSAAAMSAVTKPQANEDTDSESSADAKRLGAVLNGTSLPDDPPPALASQFAGLDKNNPSKNRSGLENISVDSLKENNAAEEEIQKEDNTGSQEQSDISPNDPLFSVFDQFLNGKTVDDNLRHSLSAVNTEPELISEDDVADSAGQQTNTGTDSGIDSATDTEIAESSINKQEEGAATDGDKDKGSPYSFENAMNWAVPKDDDFDITKATQPMPLFAPQDIPAEQGTIPSALPEADDEANIRVMLEPVSSNHQDHSQNQEAVRNSQAEPENYLQLSDKHVAAMLQAKPAIDLDPALRRELTDALNLALLYFESGNTEKAHELIARIKVQGDTDLQDRARELEERYA